MLINLFIWLINCRPHKVIPTVNTSIEKVNIQLERLKQGCK